MNAPRISIVIPMHSLSHQLKVCLESIREYATAIHELIIIGDGLTIDKNSFSQFGIPNIQLASYSENRGPAFARNEGAKRATGEIIFFIDSDVTIKSDTLGKLTEHFTSTNASDAIIGSYDDAPMDKSIVSKYRNLLHHYTHQQASEKATTFWGACGAIRKEVFWAVNGFDTSFKKPSVEDIELGYRLLNNGHNIRLDKGLLVKHLKKWTFWNVLRTDLFSRAIPWTKLLYHYRKLGTSSLNTSLEERVASLSVGLMVGTIIFTPIYHQLALLTMFLIMIVLVIKRKTYGFFYRKFRFYQFPIVIFLHWTYLLCALTGFTLGTVDYLIRNISIEQTSKKESGLPLNFKKEKKEI